MTVSLFKSKKTNAKPKPSKVEQALPPQAVYGNGTQPSVSSVAIQSGYYPSQVSLIPSPPANPGWPGPCSPYAPSPQRPATAQPYLAPPSSSSPYGSYPPQQGYFQSTTHLAVPQQQVHKKPSKWGSATNLKATFNNHANKASASVTNLAQATTGAVTTLSNGVHDRTAGYLCQGASLCDVISSKFNHVLTSIDEEIFSGNERELVIYADQPPYQTWNLAPEQQVQKSAEDRSLPKPSSLGSNYFSKVWLYSNARLPPHLPPLKIYMPTYPLLCLAAQYSLSVYERPTKAERETHVEANWHNGTKAMVLKSLPLDDINTVIFAIRGSQNFMDWAVNFRPAPKAPEGFLDDSGNLCHSGFLYVARQMVAPVAARLRTLLQENPARSNCSLVITGHSAGGAIAALLYAHMMSTTVQSELTHLTAFFKRVHCITFGAPPVSLLPLMKSKDKRHQKSLFFSFLNEGDPVARADPAVVKSLLKLYAAPAPGSCLGSISQTVLPSSAVNLIEGSGKPGKKPTRPKPGKSSSSPAALPTPSAIWRVPPGGLSNAGRLVLLREKPGTVGEKNIEAVVVQDEQLRGVIFGDPVRHMMTLYATRVEGLATKAVTGRGS